MINIMIVFYLFSNVYAHFVDLDPNTLISAMIIFGGSGTIITDLTDDGDYTATCKVDVTKKSIQSNESEKIDSTESKIQDKIDDTITPNKLPNTE